MTYRMWNAFQDEVIEANKVDDLSESQPTKGNIEAASPRSRRRRSATWRRSAASAAEALGHREFMMTKLYRSA